MCSMDTDQVIRKATEEHCELLVLFMKPEMFEMIFALSCGWLNIAIRRWKIAAMKGCTRSATMLTQAVALKRELIGI